MHAHFLDPFRPLASPVHAAESRVKFVLALAFILTVSLTPIGAWPAYVLLLALVVSSEVLSMLGIGYVMKRANLALPFALAAVPLVFTTEGSSLFAFHLGAWTIVATAEGLARFMSVCLKSWLSVQAAIVLASSTAFPELLHAMRSVGVPRLLVAMFGLMWRYLFVLVDEALRLMRARAARSGIRSTQAASRRPRPGGSLWWRGRVAGGMAGSLFLRAFERSDRIYVAMLSRGYDGEVRSLPAAGLKAADWAVLAAGLAGLGLVLAFGVLFWG
jgi:cobalt/nickel transport system permease protein